MRISNRARQMVSEAVRPRLERSNQRVSASMMEIRERDGIAVFYLFTELWNELTPEKKSRFWVATTLSAPMHFYNWVEQMRWQRNSIIPLL